MFTIKNNDEVYSAPMCTYVTMNVQAVVCASLGSADTDGDEDMGDI